MFTLYVRDFFKFCSTPKIRCLDQIKETIDTTWQEVPSSRGSSKTIVLKTTANERTSLLFDELSPQQLTLIADSALLACDEEVSEEIIPAMSWEPSVITAADDTFAVSESAQLELSIGTEIHDNATDSGWDCESQDGDDTVVEISLSQPDLMQFSQEQQATTQQQFTKTMKDTGFKIVGKVKPGRKTRVWLTPPVRASIRQPNSLRRKIKTHRKE